MSHCPSCERSVVGRKDTSEANSMMLYSLIAGFITCGLTWWLMPIFAIQNLLIKPTCPICGTAVQGGAS